jgi:hypothetical protein
MDKYERNWERDNQFRAIQINNKKEEEPELEAVSVSLKNLHEEFIEGFNHFRPMYQEILDDENMDRLEKIHESWSNGKEEVFDSDLWSKYYDLQRISALAKKCLFVDIAIHYILTHQKLLSAGNENDSDEAEEVVQSRPGF